MADFRKAYEQVLKIEGGYVNNPSDRGGETWAGIARKRNSSWSGWKIIDDLKRKPGFPKSLDKHSGLKEMKLVFYKSNYWDRLKLDQVNEPGIAIKLLDIGVNMGTAVAAKMLQRALNVSNRQEKYYRDMAEDGVIGPVTLKSVNSHPRPDVVFKMLNVFQGQRYVDLAERQESQEDFINGWFMNRIAGIERNGNSKNIA